VGGVDKRINKPGPKSKRKGKNAYSCLEVKKNETPEKKSENNPRKQAQNVKTWGLERKGAEENKQEMKGKRTQRTS